MITIEQLLNYSWMSQAAYLDFAGLLPNTLNANLIAKLNGGTDNNKFSLETTYLPGANKAPIR